MDAHSHIAPFFAKSITPVFGFIQLENIQYAQKVKSAVKFVECTTIAPGFPKYIHFRNRYIRGMIPGTSLQASSTVIEQA